MQLGLRLLQVGGDRSEMVGLKARNVKDGLAHLAASGDHEINQPDEPFLVHAKDAKCLVEVTEASGYVVSISSIAGCTIQLFNAFISAAWWK